MTSTPVVGLHGLTKQFGDQRALDGVDLTIEPGRVHALIGENGSGKSTLIKCLTGVYTPDGRDQLRWGPGHGPGGVVVVHQDLGLIPTLSVAENFGIGIGYRRNRLGGIAWRPHRRQVAAALEEAGVVIDPGALVGDLTQAERTVVTIARALQGSQGEARLLILDEPTASLPHADREQVLATARSLAEQGVAVLYVSHHLDEIVAIADDVTVLRDGRVVTTQSMDGVGTADLLQLMSGASQTPFETSTAHLDAPVVLSVRALRTGLLQGVDLDVRAGEVVGLVGARDSGAMTLCRAVAGLEDHTGSVSVDGAELPARKPSRATAAGVLIVPGDRRREGIVPTLSVAANLRLGTLRGQFPLSRVSARRERAAVAGVMDEYDIRPRDPDRLVGLLSGGNQQKVVIARCLATGPRLLVLENPTQGVDPAARAHIRRLVRAAAAEGMAVLIADIDEAEVAAAADRVIRMEDGRLLESTAVMS